MGDVKRCCKYLLPSILSGIAFACSGFANFWCETIEFTPKNGSSNLPNLEFGPWYISKTEVNEINGRLFVRDVCTKYPSGTHIDSTWKTVRAFSVMAPLIGGFLTFALIFGACDTPHYAGGRWQMLAGISIIILPLFQGLTFLIFQSNACENNPVVSAIGTVGTVDLYENACQWSDGLNANVTACVLWFAAGVYMLAIGAPTLLERPPPETQEVTYQKTDDKDGTQVVSEVAVVKGTAVSQDAEPEGPKPLED